MAKILVIIAAFEALVTGSRPFRCWGPAVLFCGLGGAWTRIDVDSIALHLLFQ
jgi:hypothetical protein